MTRRWYPLGDSNLSWWTLILVGAIGAAFYGVLTWFVRLLL